MVVLHSSDEREQLEPPEALHKPEPIRGHLLQEGRLERVRQHELSASEPVRVAHDCVDCDPPEGTPWSLRAQVRCVERHKAVRRQSPAFAAVKADWAIRAGKLVRDGPADQAPYVR